MLGEVYGRIAAQQQAERDTAELSARVLMAEQPQMSETEAREASWYPLIGHPLVATLADEHGASAPGAALAYMADMEQADAPAVIRWMQSGAYKGLFGSDEEFCQDQFSDALDDHFAAWEKRAEIGFPEVALSELIEAAWAEIAYHAVGGPVMNTDDQVFYSIECATGVYVFDISIGFDQHRAGE